MVYPWETLRPAEEILGRVGTRAGNRVLRLAAVALIRKAWGLLDDSGARSVVGVIEAYADGDATTGALHNAHEVALRSLTTFEGSDEYRSRPAPVWIGIKGCAFRTPLYSSSGDRERRSIRLGTDYGIIAAGGHLAEQVLRCTLGGIERPARFIDEWRTVDTLDLGASAYKTRNFDGMPALADAMEEAGCDDAEILGHLKDDSVHARGCWVLDALLGRGPRLRAEKLNPKGRAGIP